MRSGVIWREYGWNGWFSDNEQFRRCVRGDWETVTEFASKYRGAATGGETPEFNYSALDAAMAADGAEEMLGSERLTEFLERGIWHAIGAEAPASWAVDIAETAIGPCCFRATVRDLARFGPFVLNMDDRSYRPPGSISLPQGIRRSMRYPGIIHPSIPAARSTSLLLVAGSRSLGFHGDRTLRTVYSCLSRRRHGHCPGQRLGCMDERRLSAMRNAQST